MGLVNAAMGMVAAGGILSAIGAQQEGAATAAAQNFNAATKRRDAALALEQAQTDAAAARRASQQTLGAMRAGYGAAGVTGEGSVMDALASSAALAELDRQTILYKGQLRSIGAREDASLSQLAARTAVSQARYRSASALLTAGGTATAIKAKSTVID